MTTRKSLSTGRNPSPLTSRVLLGKALSSRRDDLRMTLTYVARKARVSKGHVSAMEHGIANPSVGVLLRIARVLGCGIALEEWT